MISKSTPSRWQLKETRSHVMGVIFQHIFAPMLTFDLIMHCKAVMSALCLAPLCISRFFHRSHHNMASANPRQHQSNYPEKRSGRGTLVLWGNGNGKSQWRLEKQNFVPQKSSNEPIVVAERKYLIIFFPRCLKQHLNALSCTTQQKRVLVSASG